jgi:acyl-CoA reductase-like NAD-dependent aldehyde dehydrogenase
MQNVSNQRNRKNWTKNKRDALARANKSPYGLGDSVWSADQERFAAIAAKIEVGRALVNAHNAVMPDTPYSGAN